MADEVIVDALPYIDHGYDDVGVRESVIKLFYSHFFVMLKFRFHFRR